MQIGSQEQELTILRPLGRPEHCSPTDQVLELQGFVAKGGMGRVFFAHRLLPGQTPQPVAVKRLEHQEDMSGQKGAELYHEGELGLWLNHPNIVKTLDLIPVATRQGLEWVLVLEWVEGPTLHQVLNYLRTQRKVLSPAAATAILIQVAEGLAHAIATIGPSGKPLNLVHRDLKPANLMLTRRGEVKIMDLGIARYDGRTLMTQALMIKGTPGYAAPETALMNSSVLTPASDVFSLGMIYYRMLTGQSLVNYKTPLEYFQAITRFNARPQVMALPETLNPLKDCLYRMLRRQPEARYQDPWALALDLRERLPGLPGAETAWDDLAQLSQEIQVPAPQTQHIELDRHAYLPPLIVPAPFLVTPPPAQIPLQSPVGTPSTLPQPTPASSLPTVAASVAASGAALADARALPGQGGSGWLPRTLAVVLVLANILLLWLVWARLAGPAQGAITPQQPAILVPEYATRSSEPQLPVSSPPGKPAPALKLPPPPKGQELNGNRRISLSPAEEAGQGTSVLESPARPGKKAPSSPDRPSDKAEGAPPQTPKPEAQTPSLTVLQAGEGDADATAALPRPTPPREAPPPEADPTRARAPAPKPVDKVMIHLRSIPLASFYLDGRKVSTLEGVTLRVMPGTHQIDAVSESGVRQQFQLEVGQESRSYRWFFETRTLEPSPYREERD